MPYVVTTRVWSAAERKTYYVFSFFPWLMMEGVLAYTNTYRWEDVHHTFPDLRHALVLERVAMAGLSLDVASTAPFWCDTNTCINWMRILVWLGKKW
jgi:hypothetical protein